jgi:ribosomal protein S18 acetylase RimI-like enzyme
VIAPAAPLPPRLTLADLPRAVEVQAEAFFTDPLWTYLIPDEARRRRLLRQVFAPAFRFGILNAQAYGAHDAAGALAGVALWSLPGERTRIGAAVRAGFAGLALNFGFVRLLPRALPAFARFEAFHKPYAGTPHAYLQTIAVHPSAQGQGVASRLIRPFLALAEANGWGAYTETMTPENVSLYEHYGMHVIASSGLPARGAAGGALRVWGFWKPPV